MSCKTLNAFTYCIIIVTLCVNLLLNGIKMCCYDMLNLVDIANEAHATSIRRRRMGDTVYSLWTAQN